MNSSPTIGALAAALVKAQATGDPHQEGPLLLAISRQIRPRNRWAATTTPDRLMEKVVFGATDCWFWRGSLNRLGYGCMVALGESKAHRVSYRLFRGPIAEGLSVLHRCDVRNCVNPDHLYLGTQFDNMRDCVRRGRHRNTPRYGEENPMARLTLAQVAEMREVRERGGLSFKKIAKMFNVSTMTAYRAIVGQSWRLQ